MSACLHEFPITYQKEVQFSNQTQKYFYANQIICVLIMSHTHFRINLHFTVACFESHCSRLTSDIAPVLSEEFLGIQTNTAC